MIRLDYMGDIKDLPVEYLANTNCLWLLRTREFQLDLESGTFVGTAPDKARPADLVSNMWKKTTGDPQWKIRILNNGRKSCADRQNSNMKLLNLNVYRDRERISGPFVASPHCLPKVRNQALSLYNVFDCYMYTRIDTFLNDIYRIV